MDHEVLEVLQILHNQTEQEWILIGTSQPDWK